MPMFGKIKEYAKLSRSFNIAFTGMAPVLGAVSVGEYGISTLFLLFIIGCLGHMYGFALNDYLDIGVDKESSELSERPLVKRSISKKGALSFILASLLSAFLLCIAFFPNMVTLAILGSSSILVTLYNMTNKKLPGVDVILSASIFALVLFGGYAPKNTFENLTYLIAGVGAVQVLFMNVVLGGLKDIEHDKRTLSKTSASSLGVAIKNKRVEVSRKFKLCASGIEVSHISLSFAPFIFLQLPYQLWQISLMLVVSIAILYITKLVLSIDYFERRRLRKLVGIHYMVSFSLAPLILASVNTYVLLLVVVPPIAFVGSNLLLHGTYLNPQTM